MSEEKKGFIAEFKEFISRGNAIDLAVGMVVGAAFTAIVTSLVNNIIMPAIGLILGGINFESLRVVIRQADEAAGIEELAIAYGSFIQAVVNFIIIAFVVFLVVRAVNRLRAKLEERKTAQETAEEEPEADPEPSREEVLLTEIRDILQKK
ncbi:MAG TPA: large-conductance mechanosensitive channel protein MscL [Bacillota bacterium]|nr:large-conductance mechanosensitive channel protein MscL [Bacillota bacterium]HQC36607.1 large-conductance mechanosensitive channel protein MscL [Bacillota bacterium]